MHHLVTLEVLHLGILDGVATLDWSHIDVVAPDDRSLVGKLVEVRLSSFVQFTVRHHRACEEHASDVGIDRQEGAKGRVLAADHIVVANAISSSR